MSLLLRFETQQGFVIEAPAETFLEVRLIGTASMYSDKGGLAGYVRLRGHDNSFILKAESPSELIKTAMTLWKALRVID